MGGTQKWGSYGAPAHDSGGNDTSDSGDSGRSVGDIVNALEGEQALRELQEQGGGLGKRSGATVEHLQKNIAWAQDQLANNQKLTESGRSQIQAALAKYKAQLAGRQGSGGRKNNSSNPIAGGLPSLGISPPV